MRPALAVCLLCCVGSAVSAPNRRGTNEILIGEVDIAMSDAQGDGAGGAIVAGDDDSPETSTEQPFAKKCIVDNKAYSHSQMIPWTDSSSHCLCVAGEVYCWWQKYGVPKSRTSDLPIPPEEDEQDEGEEDAADDEDDPSSWTTEEEETDYVEGPSESPEASGESALLEASGEQRDDHSIGVSEGEASAPETLANSTMSSSSKTTTTTTTTMTTARPTRAPATCLVMGRKYQEGEVLPHSTGNCVECSCGSEGRIECSPRDCVGLRPQNAEAAGTGDFELFDFEHERGIEESF